LALSPGHYFSAFNKAFRSPGALSEKELRAEITSAEMKTRQFPAGAPILLFGGERDYSLPFNYENYPAELIEAWNNQSSSLKIRMATLSDYMDRLLPQVRADKYDIPVVTGGSRRYGYSAFWMNAPFCKQWYRRSEHQLQSAEAMATMASLKGKMQYPSQEFGNSWLLMVLNMDRSLLWGVAVDGAFCDVESWDACDRFEYVDAVCAEANRQALSQLTQKEESSVALFNPVNWTRKTPFEIHLPRGQVLAGENCQLLEDGKTALAQVPLRSFSLSSMKLEWAGVKSAVKTALPDSIDTTHYSAKIDPNSGALVSLKLRSSGREILGGPANVILAESKGDPHWIPEKSKRALMASSSNFRPVITVAEGKLATIVEIRSDFHGGGRILRVVRFYRNSRRIGFITETNNVPSGTILSVQFPLADQITELRRGIPYGFSHRVLTGKDSRLTRATEGIFPAIRWSDYGLESGGAVALLDRGVPARELVGSTAILLLHNVCDTYYKRPVTWMNHTGRQTYEYALVVREQPWNQANVPRMAWEYNNPVVAMAGRSVCGPESLVETSDNVIVQALRRDDVEIELRLMECLGESGPARIKVNLPHAGVALTNLIGQERRLLEGLGEYTFDVRPQQIVTLRLCASGTVAPVKALRSFDSVIPIDKRQYMRSSRNPRLVGHPPTE
jgi:alpha-mannosidase